MRVRNIFIIVYFTLFIIGCSSKDTQINLDEKAPNQVPMKKREIYKPKKGSLYTRRGGSLFADKKDLQIGDIIQVNIQEVLKRDSKNTKQLSKDTSTNLGGGLLSPRTGVNTTSGMNTFNRNFGIGFDAKSSNSFKGSAQIKNDEQFSTMISAVIVKIFKNGNYFIRGKKELLINNQKQIIAISGVIRPYDISSDNVVNSNQVANLKILYKKIGDEADTMKKPWGSRLLEKIWPF